MRRFRPLLRTHLRILPSPRAIQRSSLDERARNRLAEEFAGFGPAVIDGFAWRNARPEEKRPKVFP